MSTSERIFAVTTSQNNHDDSSGGGIRRRSHQSLSRQKMNHPATLQQRRLTGYCGWKIWNTTSGKTCDQVAKELVGTTTTNNNNSDGSTTILTVAQAKSQILKEGCICQEGEKSFDDNVITPMAFCGKCRFKNANFSCDDRVEFVMNNYPEDNPTLTRAKMNLLKNGDCIDRNWTPYAFKVQVNNDGNVGGGLTGGAIAGIVIAALALCLASTVGCCILRDLKKVKSDGDDTTKMQGVDTTTTLATTKNNKPKPTLNVIEEGEEEEESVMGVEMSVMSAGSSAPQSRDGDCMADDVTEIITNRGNSSRGDEES
eukprot:CAMPEP_0201694506 /NCGR_PEP_ID=MMETSP0578-20130828/6749_1 /ASSEMBLY_ACC=CAM_ASM_000663 /TAXON_ID=267565 /ORGANISM="Skeletonema grethea, Strain CCMP 1804" /LENGTH=312 /DNA_ID=CAMNT_0048180193 /DNA_START=113 /DNA_END=1051 /DNA_ORIENTATION=+